MKALSTGLLIFALSGLPAIVSCDRTVKHEESSSTSSDGTVKTTDTTVKKDSNGNTITDQTKTTDKPQTGQ
jgi:hypothetical protein